MTTAELYVRDGSRFVVYDPRRQHTPPIPTPRPLPDVDDPTVPSAGRPVVEVRPGHYQLHAPRCPHGSFVRWAALNCKPCAREEARRGR